MPDKKVRSRRNFLISISQLAATGFVASATATAAAAIGMSVRQLESSEKQTEATAEKVVDALQDAYGLHPGQRRNHTKGVGALGTFIGNPKVKEISRSGLFSGEKLDIVARFSIAGGDPVASDAEKSPRGMALEFRLPDGSLHHMTMLSTPMFFAATPKTFLDKFIALAINPATGKPDPAKFKQFEASHPDNVLQTKFLQENNPPPSYANSAFYGIHAFKFINDAGKTMIVKFRFVPQDGEKQLSNAQLASMPRNFLEQALMERMRTGSVNWDMIVTIGEPGDPETNPTLFWPKNRRELKAGTLTLTSATPSDLAGSYQINYDPLIVADGIAPTDDPILLFRSSSYATSHTRRIRDL
ncbi:catalase family peroxidase [Hassallia byssoidea VB512170]|uniref:Catalase-related peroxidase n=1 Tax=Hassallia byssoidea VB512170 TaxID=1304833 RepID=A0A846H8I8_9CYAN|nr:catalase family peroxidase [Hassalia byssoidea]NEU72920.1 catalase family peroxidase [Hassalia byssoidea VB512170]